MKKYIHDTYILMLDLVSTFAVWIFLCWHLRTAGRVPHRAGSDQLGVCQPVPRRWMADPDRIPVSPVGLLAAKKHHKRWMVGFINIHFWGRGRRARWNGTQHMEISVWKTQQKVYEEVPSPSRCVVDESIKGLRWSRALVMTTGYWISLNNSNVNPWWS